MQLQDILYQQGFGVRRVCCGLVQQGHVLVWPRQGDEAPQRVTDAAQDFDPHGLRLRVQGLDWVCHSPAYVMLHKPAGTECSQRPSAWPSVYTLLPAPLRQRPVRGSMAGVQAVGRLDQDTTGLLLLSDDGHFIHRMASPRKQVPKVYRVTARHPVTAAMVRQLLAGVVLDDDPRPVRAAACEVLDEHTLNLTLTAGKYHQVKRMVAAVGNRVDALHRWKIGPLTLPVGLQPGQWRWLDADEVAALMPSP